MIRIALVSTLLCSCGIARFNVEQALPEQRVQGSLLGGILPSFLPNPSKFNIDIKSEVAKRGTGPAHSAYLTSLTFQITPHDTPSGNFDFISDAHLFVEAPNLGKVEFAKLTMVPKSAIKLDFEIVPNIDLLPFINAGATISATANGTQPTKDTRFDGNLIVEVRI